MMDGILSRGPAVGKNPLESPLLRSVVVWPCGDSVPDLQNIKFNNMRYLFHALMISICRVNENQNRVMLHGWYTDGGSTPVHLHISIKAFRRTRDIYTACLMGRANLGPNSGTTKRDSPTGCQIYAYISSSLLLTTDSSSFWATSAAENDG